ncbi:Integral membrane protein Pth11-like [Venustampulla echinocandica]|uniref:Integral membrane protein Pth11-like n=1 Tax=Venustampulla echinocandica TaxID=2656787 RepID=A0A370TL44_9HELO|nr:Integral membrane protein Pth11-like [Venustampulla echinocandica]RDL36250.1 Integral membrane protein Pth11-like [Venustampulla echinocandica]
MTFYSSPPAATEFDDAKPTLLVAWWITLFCTCLILLRLAGRYIRLEKLYPEDKITAVVLLPLYVRIACVHFVLLYGTNNAQFAFDLSPEEVHKKVTGSRLVLAGRVFYAATLWTLKLATLEFLGRIAGASMNKSSQKLIVLLRYTLAVSFVAVVISDLVECRPISHYWQVIPDPGPKCRQGFAQLLTMGLSSIILDVILIALPVPIILSTRIATKRKVLLVLLFAFGFLTVGITLYRIPQIIQRHGDQVVRSMWASVELLAATTVANLAAVGSFLRDSGAKKSKFRPGYDNGTGATASQRQMQVAASQWVGDERNREVDSGEWTDDIEPEVVVSSSSKNQKRHDQSCDVRGTSSSESRYSLVRPGQRASSQLPGVLEHNNPRMPSPVLLDSIRDFQRG